ncbi:MAG: outer membrane beta-barrel protein [Proteobacteria bacterium]|nr:outer membrane beta-barrel protein [Pseudomonadota bacterium]
MIEKLTGLALVAGSTLIIAAGPASANDWAGPYIGIGGGYDMTNTRVDTLLTDGLTNIDYKKNGQAGAGGFLTLSAGYDHALFGPLVVGVFVDYDFSDADTNFSNFLFSETGHLKLGDQLSVGGRIGYLVAPTTLFFSTFGYAHSDPSDVTINFGPSSMRAGLGSFNGYFLGSGVETLIGNGFSLKAEYRYTSMRSEDAVFNDTVPSATLIETLKPQTQTVRMSLNYRFGDGKKDVVDNSIPPITSSWTGPYLGFGAGYSVAQKQETFPSGASTLNNPVSNNGGFISATVGYDYQFSKKFVVGALADADMSNLRYKDELSFSGTPIYESRGGFKNILMVGGRLGYLTAPDTLLFVSGGYANAGLEETTISLGGTGAILYDAKRISGAFIGAGLESKIWDSLSIKAEYRYIDLASENLELFPGTGSPFPSAHIDPDIQTGRISLNWRP